MKTIWLCFALSLLLLSPFSSDARPRPFYPPVPTFSAALYHDKFDADYVHGATNSVTTVGNFSYTESWNCYALDRRGSGVFPYTISGTNAEGRQLIAGTNGAFRFWVQPSFSSVPAGTGPGATARLLDFAAFDGSSVLELWHLDIDAAGTNIALIAESDTGPVELLSAAINWEAGVSYCVGLNYGTNGSSLFLNNALVTTGPPTVYVLPKFCVVTIGSALDGSMPAQSALDEFY